MTRAGERASVSLVFKALWWRMAEEISHMWTLLRVARTDLYLGQVEDFGEDADVVGV